MEGNKEGEELRLRDAACLFLVFAGGARPDRLAMLNAVGKASQVAVSHDPGDIPGEDGDSGLWLELLINGLTFDCMGLSPGPSLFRSPERHCFAVNADDLTVAECIALTPGPHLAGAENSIPVVRSIMALGVALGRQLDGAVAFQWKPSTSLIGIEYFTEVVDQWLEGGPFPALGLGGIVPVDDLTIRSDGLSFFSGQEVELDLSLVRDRTAGSQLLVRIVDLLVGAELLTHEFALIGPDGRPLVLVPSDDGKIVHVRVK